MPHRRSKRRVLLALGWNSSRLLYGIGQYGHEAGWHLETRTFFTETIPKGWQGQGMVVSSTMNEELLAFMQRQAPLQPTVLLGANQIGLRLPQVMEDNRKAGMLAARHFIEKGYRNFAWLTPQRGPVATERLDGFEAVLQEAGFRCHIIEATEDALKGAPLASWLVKELRRLPKPLALFALDDQVASETIDICTSQRWRVPEDIAILGVGNIDIVCKCSHVPISSVDLSEEELGRRTAMLLDKLMRGGKPPLEPVVVAPRGLIARQSTDNLLLTNPALKVGVAYIKANLRRSLSLDQIADTAGISRRSLYRLFERDLRLTPADFILQARLEAARRELSIPGKKIAAVVAQCGFGSTRTLERHFLKYEGVTPQAWQKENAGIKGD